MRAARVLPAYALFAIGGVLAAAGFVIAVGGGLLVTYLAIRAIADGAFGRAFGVFFLGGTVTEMVGWMVLNAGMGLFAGASKLAGHDVGAEPEGEHYDPYFP